MDGLVFHGCAFRCRSRNGQDGSRTTTGSLVLALPGRPLHR